MTEIVYPVIPGLNDKKEYLTRIASDLYYCSIFTVHGFEKRRPILRQRWYDHVEVPKHEDLVELATAARDAFKNIETVRVISHKGEMEI